MRPSLGALVFTSAAFISPITLPPFASAREVAFISPLGRGIESLTAKA